MVKRQRLFFSLLLFVMLFMHSSFFEFFGRLLEIDFDKINSSNLNYSFKKEYNSGIYYYVSLIIIALYINLRKNIKGIFFISILSGIMSVIFYTCFLRCYYINDLTFIEYKGDDYFFNFDKLKFGKCFLFGVVVYLFLRSKWQKKTARPS